MDQEQAPASEILDMDLFNNNCWPEFDDLSSQQSKLAIIHCRSSFTVAVHGHACDQCVFHLDQVIPSFFT
jgi:cAMP phosphodiesterase